MGIGYESLASTKLLATHCAVCNRPLRDALSTERGIGPDCAERYGYLDPEVTEEARLQANHLIFLIADKRQGPPAVEAARQLRELGFAKLAGIILERLVPIRLERVGDRLRLFTPYDPDVTARLTQVPGRWFNREEVANEFPYSSKNALWLALRELFVGKKMLGPAGELIEIPAAPRGSGFGDVDY